MFNSISGAYIWICFMCGHIALTFASHFMNHKFITYLFINLIINWNQNFIFNLENLPFKVDALLLFSSFYIRFPTKGNLVFHVGIELWQPLSIGVMHGNGQTNSKIWVLGVLLYIWNLLIAPPCFAKSSTKQPLCLDKIAQKKKKEFN